jgi:hypothetical protein
MYGSPLTRDGDHVPGGALLDVRGKLVCSRVRFNALEKYDRTPNDPLQQ